MRILGISAFYHDSAAALLEDGKIIAAAQEERFSRKKHDSEFPKQAISYCLEQASIAPEDINYVAFYDKPFLKFERLMETYVAFAPRGFQSFRRAVPLWLKEKLFQKRLLREELKNLAPELDWEARLLFAEHHQSHAASAFFASPFEKAVVLTMDGVGEWTTTSVGIGEGNQLSIIKEIHFPHSLGLLYSAFTHYTGFRVNSGEYKVMGLAPYGKPKYVQKILENLIDLKDDGSFRINLSYFDYCTGLTMTNARFDRLFGGPARDPGDPLTQRDMDLAASVQQVLEEAILRMTRSLASETAMPNICLAGGVALNCVANGKILRDGRFDGLWIQPAAGDAGGALGAALAAYHQFQNRPRKVWDDKDLMNGSYLGPKYDQDEIERRLAKAGAHFVTLSDSTLIEQSSEALAQGKALGWFQGRMEFGPRALGSRSILGDARSTSMQSILNLKVKHRESFRPFAPSILSEKVSDWFNIDVDSPYMMLVAEVTESRRHAVTKDEDALFGIDKLRVPRSDIPAVTHVDYSARVQTVHRDTNTRFHELITHFEALTGCPLILNTSFNVRGEPIVCTPEDAFRCFMGTGLDVLAIGNCLLNKVDQDPSLLEDYKNELDPD